MSRGEQLRDALRRILDSLDAMQRGKATEAVEWELQELRQVFALLVMGEAVGLPSPPGELTLELLPDMEDELRLLLQRIDTAQTPFSQLFSSLPME